MYPGGCFFIGISKKREPDGSFLTGGVKKMNIEQRIAILEKAVAELTEAARPKIIIRAVPEGHPVTGYDLKNGMEIIDLISDDGIPEWLRQSSI